MDQSNLSSVSNNVFDKCVLISLTVHVIGQGRQGDKGEIVTGANKNLLTINKKLFEECEEYKELCSVGNLLRDRVKDCCLGAKPFEFTDKDGKKKKVGGSIQSLLKSGTYLLSVESITKAEEVIEEWKPKFETAVVRFLDKYEDIVQASMRELGPQANSNDYKSADQVKKDCYVEYSYMSVGIPDNLASSRPDIFQREKAQAVKAWTDAAEEIRMAPRIILRELISHLMDKLKDGPDGKKKVLRTSAITKIKEYIEDFPARDIANDVELRNYVEEIRRVMAGITQQRLKNDEDTRDRVLYRLEEAKQVLDTMIVDAPSRSIAFVED